MELFTWDFRKIVLRLCLMPKNIEVKLSGRRTTTPICSTPLDTISGTMEVDDEEMEQPTSSSKGEKKRFEVKKVKIASHPGTSLSLSHSLILVSSRPFSGTRSPSGLGVCPCTHVHSYKTS